MSAPKPAGFVDVVRAGEQPSTCERCLTVAEHAVHVRDVLERRRRRELREGYLALDQAVGLMLNHLDRPDVPIDFVARQADQLAQRALEAARLLRKIAEGCR